jgi:hypothetical protein
LPANARPRSKGTTRLNSSSTHQPHYLTKEIYALNIMEIRDKICLFAGASLNNSKQPRQYEFAFARRRSGVRIPSAPLRSGRLRRNLGLALTKGSPEVLVRQGRPASCHVLPLPAPTATDVPPNGLRLVRLSLPPVWPTALEGSRAAPRPPVRRRR